MEGGNVELRTARIFPWSETKVSDTLNNEILSKNYEGTYVNLILQTEDTLTGFDWKVTTGSYYLKGEVIK